MVHIEPTKNFDERLMDIERMLQQQENFKLSYETIYNEPIHPSVPKIDIPLKFEIPRIEPFK